MHVNTGNKDEATRSSAPVGPSLPAKPPPANVALTIIQSPPSSQMPRSIRRAAARSVMWKTLAPTTQQRHSVNGIVTVRANISGRSKNIPRIAWTRISGPQKANAAKPASFSVIEAGICIQSAKQRRCSEYTPIRWQLAGPSPAPSPPVFGPAALRVLAAGGARKPGPRRAT